MDPSQYKYKQTLEREQRCCLLVLTSLLGHRQRPYCGEGGGGGGGVGGGGDADGRGSSGSGSEGEADREKSGGSGLMSISGGEARTVLGCILQELRSPLQH